MDTFSDFEPRDPDFEREASNAFRRPPHIEVASDREAMRMALQEYAVREMFEGGDWGSKLSTLFAEAVKAARAEFNAAPINTGEAPF